MVDIINNFVLYNAPAGSGKTTSLKRMLMDLHYKNINAKFLCITFTNRAADEMKESASKDYVFSSTIHSFLYAFIAPYLKLDIIIDDYIDFFKDSIMKKIDLNDPNNKEHIEKYKEKFNCKEVTLKVIRNNIHKIEYYETPFSIYLEGKMSHDDLLGFTVHLFNKYPVLKVRLVDTYDYIFIDEYQDTDDSIIELFYNSVKESRTRLYLFGDRMQQIYKSGSFFLKEHIGDFTVQSLSINYRSSSEIVNCLNNIYNTKEFNQKSYMGKLNIKPKFIVTSCIESTLDRVKASKEETLELYLLNRSKYISIGVDMIFEKVTNMNKYHYGAKYTVNDVLTKLEDNPDALFKILYTFCDLDYSYKNNNIGHIWEVFSKTNFLNKSTVYIGNHNDKEVIKLRLENLFKELESSIPILDFLNYIKGKGFIKETSLEFLDEDYNNLLQIPSSYFVKLFNFQKESLDVSTQHGVKGESHDNVIFISDDYNNNPCINTSELYKLFTKCIVSFESFENFNYKYLNFQNALKDTSDLEKDSLIRKFAEDNQENVYYQVICKSIFDNYISRPTSKNRSAIKKTIVERVFQAYKLFYVGCSRARKKLFVIVDENKVHQFKDDLIEKMSYLGFEAYEE